MRISILGVGRLGGSFAIGLSRVGFQVDKLIVRHGHDVSEVSRLVTPTPLTVSSEDLEMLDCDVLVIAVSDPLIEPVALRLTGKLAARTVVLHTSGSLSSDVLRSLREEGHSVGSIHPLVSFSDPSIGAERMRGAYYCIEGDSEAVSAANAIVEKVGGHAFTVAGDKKALYHAAAVTACGHLVALLDVAFEMLSECGVSKDDAKDILMPLVKGTVFNLEKQSASEALTGPFARGDIENFERNLSAIEKSASPLARQLYLELGARSLDLAEKQGADPARIAELRDRIRLAK